MTADGTTAGTARMAQGQRITDQQIEIIHATYAETGSYSAAAHDAGCTVSTTRKYVLESDNLVELRNQKRADVVSVASTARIRLIEAMVDAEKIKRASISELATAVGILTDKIQILTGKATSRNEHISVDPSSQLTAEEMEKAAELREKLSRDGSVV